MRSPTPSGCTLAIGDSSHLRLFAEEDAAELHTLIEANREQLALWLPWAQGQTMEDTREFIELTHTQAAANESFQIAVVCDGRIAGAIGCVSFNWGDRATNIGYWLGHEFQGRGTMTAAVRALTDHGLGVWELNRIEILVASDNRQSRAIPERLGFREEGLLRQAQRVGDRYVDLVVYSMLGGDRTS